MRGHSTGFGGRPLISCVNLGSSLNLSEPHSFSCKMWLMTPPLVDWVCHCKKHSGTQHTPTYFHGTGLSSSSKKPLEGGQEGEGATEPSLNLGHHEAGQVICSSGNPELEKGYFTWNIQHWAEEIKLEDHKSGK